MRNLVYFLTSIVLAVSVALASPAQAKTFRFAYSADVASMDPYALNENFSSSFHHNVYEPLFRYNGEMELEPALAESYELVNPTTWRFHLRNGVKFSNGNGFDAEDVVFSFSRGIAEGSDMGGYLGNIAEVKKIDKYTVDIITKVADPILTNTIAPFYIMDKEWSEANDAATPVNLNKSVENYSTLHSNGTGPFKLLSREPGVKTVLIHNDGWWDWTNHKSNVTRVVLTPIVAAATRTAALISGELELMYPAPIQDVGRINSSGVATVLQGPELRTIFLGMDQDRDELLYSNVKGKNPLKDMRVRKAFYQSINIEAIKEKIMRGASEPTALMVARGISGFDASQNKRLPYDPAAAKTLLAEAGYPNGFDIQLDCPNDRYVNDEQICQAIASMLAKVGVKVNLLAQTKSKFFAKMLKHDVSLYLLGWVPDDLDSGSVIAQLMVKPEDGGLDWNGGKYGNQKILELSQQIKTEADQSKRRTMISEVFRILQEDVGYLPLHQQALSWGVAKGVHVVQRADNALHYWYINIDE